jgi:hypothetical protein
MEAIGFRDRRESGHNESHINMRILESTKKGSAELLMSS